MKQRLGAPEPDVASLPDDEVLALCDIRMAPDRQEELSDLLGRSREGDLTEADRLRLDELMRDYRIGLLRKAQAMKVAVARGLRPPLG